MKVLCGVIVLTCVSFALARNDAAYPLEKVADFLVEKLDVTTLPPESQPRPEKGKKTFEDHGYVTRKLDEKGVLLEAPHKGSQISSECACLNGKTQVNFCEAGSLGRKSMDARLLAA